MNIRKVFLYESIKCVKKITLFSYRLFIKNDISCILIIFYIVYDVNFTNKDYFFICAKFLLNNVPMYFTLQTYLLAVIL